MSNQVIIYGVGSPLLLDYEESLARAGLEICLAVKNVDGKCWLTSGPPIAKPSSIDSNHLDIPFIVPIFTPAHRQFAALEAKKIGLTSPLNLVDTSATIPRKLDAEYGLYINSNCAIGACCEFKEFVSINRGSNIGHHTHFGRFVSISSGVTIGSMVKINRGAFVGAGATILPEITIGENAIVAAGSVVTQNVPPHSLAAGNPAKIIKENIPGYKNLSVS